MPRLTSHGEVVFEPQSTIGQRHPFWGSAADWWPAQVQEPQAGCTSCGGGPPPASMAELLVSALTRKSDFHEHVATLKELADQCEVVAEVSLWDDKPGIIALAASSAKRVISVCAAHKRVWHKVKAVRPDFAAVTDDGPVRDGVDLLFWDGQHRAQEVYDALTRYAPHVARYLVVHCTTDPYGERGDDGGAGVMPAVRRFLTEHREWTAIRHDRNNHGLIVLSKDERDKRQPPGTLRKAMNFAKALAKHAADGQRLVKDHVFELRMAECLTCEMRNLDACGACGCPVEKKASWASETCGLEKIGQEPKWRAATDPADIE
jgi:hypothetical protein